MAITKVTSGLISADASSIDLNIDAGTLYLDVSENRVGIGTTSPAVTLDVTGNGRFDSVSGNALRLDRVTSGNNIDIDFHNPIGTAGVIAKIRVDGDGLSNLFGALSFHTGTTPDSPSEAMRINRSGNVGIGTASPNVHGWTKALSIDGGASNSSAVELNQNGTKVGALSLQGDQRVQVVNYTANPITFHTNGIANERMRIDSSGNVGIGTSSPSGNLEISTSASDTGVDLVLDGNKTSNGGVGSIIFNNNGDSVGMIRSNRASANDAADMLFYTQATGGSNTERMRIDSSGNLLVGTTSANFSISSQVMDGFGISGTSKFVTIGVDSTYCLALQRNGSDGVIQYFFNGTANAGNISISGSSTAYNTSSDARLKDVTGEARGLEVINELNPVSYNWKESGQADEGLIAQEVLDIVPNAVTGSEEEMYSMDYSKLVVHLVKGMKEQQAQIEALQSEINLLKGE